MSSYAHTCGINILTSSLDFFSCCFTHETRVGDWVVEVWWGGGGSKPLVRYMLGSADLAMEICVLSL